MTRDATLHATLSSIERSPLPEDRKAPLRDAITHLFSDRPNAVDKIQAPLGRALRNPLFPDIWSRAVADIPRSPAYEPLRAACQGIADFVRQHTDRAP